MRNLDFSSWHALLSTVLGLALITLIMVGVRLLAMHAVQQRRERENRQINERLRTLIAAYKTLGGSFTGNLAVDPTHLRDLKRREGGATESSGDDERAGSDRSRRVRDAVEAALSEIILLGTEEQVRLAARAATELAEGRPTHTAELVVSLRDFIRQVLDLEPVPAQLAIPRQGPTRTPASRGKGDDAKGVGKGGGGGLGGGMGGGPENTRGRPRPFPLSMAAFARAALLDPNDAVPPLDGRGRLSRPSFAPYIGADPPG